MSQSPNNNLLCDKDMAHNKTVESNHLDDVISSVISNWNENTLPTRSYKNIWLETPLKIMLNLIEEHLPGIGKFGEGDIRRKRKLWRFIKEKLAVAGYSFSVAQIEAKYRYIERYYKNVKSSSAGNEPDIGDKPEPEKASQSNKQNSQTRCSKNLQETDIKYGEIFDLLESWGLGDLKAKFKANYIVLQALDYLTEADIIELIPKIGQRAIFRARLNQWRQQKSSTNIDVPEPKKIKIEPGIEVRSQPQQLQQQQPQPQQQQQLQQQPQQQPQQIEQQISPQTQIQPNVVHKIYGNLTKIAPKPRAKRINKKAINSNNAQGPKIQSRVQQFIIGSPPSTTTTTTGLCRLPSPPSVTPALNGPKISISSPTSLFYNLPPHIECRRFPSISGPRLPASTQIQPVVSTQIHSPVSSQIYTPIPTQIHTPVSTQIHTPISISARDINSDNLSNANALVHIPPTNKPTPNYTADLTPFATSIIRVETNCETNYPSNGMPSNPMGKFKRTTIIQKLTNENKTLPTQPKMSKPIIIPKPIEKLQGHPEVTKSPEVTNSLGVAKSPEVARSTEVPKPKTILIPKIETVEVEDDDDTLDAIDWNDFCEKRTNIEKSPVVEIEPEANPGPEPEADAELEPESNPEVEEFTLSDDVTEIPDLIKDELMDSDSHSDQDANENNKDKDLLKEMIDPKEPDNSQDTKEPKGEISRLDIRNILMSSKIGRRVIKRYVAEEILDEPTKKLLIETIAQYCFDNKIHITPTYCKDIAEEIIEIFPNERIEDYYSRKGRKLRPPIYTKFHGIRREFFRRKSTAATETIQATINNTNNIESENKSTSQENDYDDDDNLIIS